MSESLATSEGVTVKENNVSTFTAKHSLSRLGPRRAMLLTGALLAMGLAPSAQATTIYTYTGNHYTTCSGTYCTGGPYALSVSFTTTLTGSSLANLPFTDISATITSFTFTDGSGLTLVSNLGRLEISTDASGNISTWVVAACGSTCDTQMQTNWNSPFGFNPGRDFSDPTVSFAGSYGFVSNNPGTWVASPGPQPLTFTEYPIPTGSGAYPGDITTGPDGALWFTEGGANKIGRITIAGSFTEYTIPAPFSSPQGIAAGPDGALWFTEHIGNKIGRITMAGAITEYPIPTTQSGPVGITAGPDGALWFTEFVGEFVGPGKIGRITTEGVITEYTIPIVADPSNLFGIGSGPMGIVAGPDGALWFTEYWGNKIGRITTGGVLSEYLMPTAFSYPGEGITAGPDGALWFTAAGDKIWRITTSGFITAYPIPSISSGPRGITVGPDGALWFTEYNGNRIGRITTAGALAEYSIPGIGGLAVGITAGPDGALWFTESNVGRIGRVASQAVPQISSATHFVPVTPCRIADTRNPNGSFGGPAIAGNTSRDFGIPSGACGIPSTAVAYSLNVAVVPSASLGFLTLWPSGQSQPRVATLNSIDGRIKSNAAIVPAGLNGAVSVFATDTTDVILDINGYFVSGSNAAALAFYPLTPCRVADTRNPTAPLGGPSLVGLGTRSFPILASSCGVPANAQAYSLNFAAVPKGPSLGFLTAWPDGQTRPLVASLNDPTGTVLANAVVVPAGTGGAVDVYATDNTDLVIDINGYFAPQGTGGLSLYTVTPCRVLDSRIPTGTPPLSTTRDVNVIAVPCGIPPTAQAFVFNATVVPPSFLGFITMWPQGQTQPLAATLNAYDGAITNNMAIMPTTTGSISVFPSDLTHLVLDVFGYFAP